MCHLSKNMFTSWWSAYFPPHPNSRFSNPNNLAELSIAPHYFMPIKSLWRSDKYIITYQSYHIFTIACTIQNSFNSFINVFEPPIKIEWVSLTTLRSLKAWLGSELDNDNRVITWYQSTPSLPWLITIWRHVPVYLYTTPRD